MHPAYSVILFTTASGAGYGLLAWLALLAPLALLPATTGFGAVALALALGLVSLGLLSSTFHLGRPERALKALSQWRTSWLSREGVSAFATYVVAGPFALAWVFLNRVDGPFAAMAGLSFVMAGVTIYCTGMIYCSLKTIRQWNNALTLPVYFALAAMTGSLLLTDLTLGFGAFQSGFGALALALTGAGALLKIAYWRAIDAEPPRSTLATATGLGGLGEIRLLEAPHTEENFVMRDMGFQIARKHAVKLRRIAALALFLAPAALVTLATAIASAAPSTAFALALLATASAALGVAVERWLFFAEATHLSMLYYGRRV